MAETVLTFEGNSLTGSGAFDSTSGSGITIESASPIFGDYSARFADTGSYGLASYSANTNDAAGAMYFKINTMPSATASLMLLRAGITNYRHIRINSDGELFWTDNGGTQIGNLSDPLTEGVVYRIEWIYQNSASANGQRLFLAVATGDGAATTVTDISSTPSSVAQSARVGYNSGTGGNFTYDEIRFNDNNTIPTLPSLSGDFEADGRLEAGMALTMQPHVTHKAAIRFELGASAVAQARPVQKAALRLEYGFGGAYIVPPEGDEEAAATWPLGLELRLQPKVTHRAALRLDMGVDQRLLAVSTGAQAAALRLLSGFDLRIQPHVTHKAALRLDMGLEQRVGEAHWATLRQLLGYELRLSAHVTHRAGLRLEYGLVKQAAMKAHYRARLRMTLGIGLRDAYVGPGTGVIADGVAFNPNDIREGDSFNVYLPWAGISGLGTLAHVKSRTINDQMAEQDLSLQVVPQPDPKLVPGMAGGGRPGLKPQRSDVARRAARQQRELDRLERNRE